MGPAIGGGESWERRALLGGAAFRKRVAPADGLVVVGAVGDRRAISAPILRGPTFGRGPARGRALVGRESPGSKGI
jgi:hypothetical protein